MIAKGDNQGFCSFARGRGHSGNLRFAGDNLMRFVNKIQRVRPVGMNEVKHSGAEIAAAKCRTLKRQ